MMKAVFINPGQNCYFLSVVKSILWACSDFSLVQVLFGDAISEICIGACRHATPITPWDERAWQVILNGWRQPERQHDASEFLLHLSSRCPNLLDLLQCTWQSMYRGADNAWIVVDAASSVGLTLDAMIDTANLSFSLLQDIINSWHLQAYVHVMLAAPDFLVVTAGRFITQSGVVSKSNCIIIPDHILKLPVFENDEFAEPLTSSIRLLCTWVMSQALVIT